MNNIDTLRNEYMTPGEVAALFRVDPRTLTRWRRSGKFPDGCVTRTLGGHTRYNAAMIRQLAKPE